MNQELNPKITPDSRPTSIPPLRQKNTAIARAAKELDINYALLHRLVDQFKSDARESNQESSKNKTKRRCFVISPIGEEDSDTRNHADDVLKFIIKPAMSAFGIEATRADHMADMGRITQHMFRAIFEADICVAILTGANPNVYYELAVAQCAARPAILLIEEGLDLPFDVKDLRCVYYSMNPVSDLVNGIFSDQIKAQLTLIEESGWMTASLFEQFPYGHLFQQEQQIQRLIEASKPQPLETGIFKRYSIPGRIEKELIILTGDVVQMGKSEIDAIVSPIDTYMETGRYHDGSISGSLRFLDADKTEGGRIKKDLMRKSLVQQIKHMDLVLPVRPGTVVETKTNQLKASHGISYVFHLATMEGYPGKTYKMRHEDLTLCVSNVFSHFKQLANAHSLTTLAFPMLGAATSQLEVMKVAQKLVQAILAEMERRECPCQKVFIIAWLEAHRHALSSVAKVLELEEITD